MAVMLALWIGWLILTGLDRRYHGSDVPIAVQGIGLALIVLGSYLVVLTLKANSYAAPVVKIQKARGHTVATTGSYAYVRHPMYAGAFLFGSWWGLAAGLGLVAVIAIRAAFEERARVCRPRPLSTCSVPMVALQSALPAPYMGPEGSARSAIVSAQKVWIWGCRGSDWRRSQRA